MTLKRPKTPKNKYWKCILTGTVPVNKNYPTGTQFLAPKVLYIGLSVCRLRLSFVSVEVFVKGALQEMLKENFKEKFELLYTKP